MKTKLALLVFVILGLTFAFPSPAFADGIIIPDPPICDPGPCPPQPLPMEQLVIRYHHVSVTIQDQLAVTHVDQVFYNPNDWTIEGTYMFPIPAEAAVTNFTLWVDGQPVQGRVLDAQEARRTYEQIVSSLRDPALLEYAGRGAVQARIFPIPPQGERRVELEYTQALAAEGGLVRYVYPLNTERFSAWPLESVTINVDIQSSIPIRAVYSPSHAVGVSRDGDHHVTAGYEDANVLPDTDFALYYSLGESQAFHLLTFRNPQDPSDPDGFFLALLEPGLDASQPVIPKDVILVLDRSGSMDGEKFIQAQEAARYIIQHLNPDDRFDLITFSTGIEMYASQLSPARLADDALTWINSLRAEGSTDINRALLEAAALADRERPTYLIFMTDGLPTSGVTDTQQIISNLLANASDNVRLFAFGVGFDVDTFLLDSLSSQQHGTSTYVLPGERLDEALSAFYQRISTPVLTDLQLDFGDVTVYDLYPEPLPDLFAGSQIIVVGRYRQSGLALVSLSGKVNELTQTYSFPEQVFEEQSETGGNLAAIPRLWATRKIGYLLNQIRLSGANQEVIDQIVRLSIRYGIVTPYTSYLVTEEAPLGATEQNRIAQQTFGQMQAQPTQTPTGQFAVQSAADQGSMAGATSASAPMPEAAGSVRISGERTFVLSDGMWIDTGFDPDRMTTIKVQFLSQDYFDLAAAEPELGAAFALGERVIALAGGQAYEVVGSGESVPPVQLPYPYPPSYPVPVTPPPLDNPHYPGPGEPPQTPPPQNDEPPGLPCGAGLLPLLLLPLGVLAVRRRR